MPEMKKGNNSANNVSGVNVVNFYTSPNHALYLCQVP